MSIGELPKMKSQLYISLSKAASCCERMCPECRHSGTSAFSTGGAINGRSFSSDRNGSFAPYSVEKVYLPERSEISVQFIGFAWNIDSNLSTT